MQNIYKLPDTVENVRGEETLLHPSLQNSPGKNEPIAVVKWGKKNLGGIGKKEVQPIIKKTLEFICDQILISV